MALPTVAINSAGSNTAASGAGPATALTGSLAQTLSSTTVNITDAVVNLSGVALDGSAVLWVNTSSGRQWSAITNITGSVGAYVVTVGTAYGVTATGQTWAIGGKRATMAGSAKLFVNSGNGDDDIADWKVDVQTGETFTGVFTFQMRTVKRGHPVTIYSSVGSAAAGTAPVLTTATNSINLIDLSGSLGLIFRNLKFTNTAGTKGTTSANGRCFMSNSSGASAIIIDSCVLDGFTVGFDADNVTYFGMSGIQLTRTEIKNAVFDAVRSNNSMAIDHCWIHDGGVNGILSVAAAGAWCVSNSVITGNTGRGFYNTTPPTSAGVIWFFVDNTIAHNGAPGIEFSADMNDAALYLTDNVLYGNTTASIKTTGVWGQVWLTNNAYESGSLSGVNAGPSDVTLTADPRVSSTDYGLNSTAGGGAAAKAAAAVPPNASANAAGDMGAIPTGGGEATAAAVFPVPTGKTTGFF